MDLAKVSVSQQHRTVLGSTGVSNILMAHDLLNRVRPKSRYNHTSFEPYNLHYLARQFGLVQGIFLPYELYAKFDQRTNLYNNKLVDWELSNKERINNFCFEKFKITSSTTPNFVSWWEAMFKKLLG